MSKIASTLLLSVAVAYLAGAPASAQTGQATATDALEALKTRAHQSYMADKYDQAIQEYTQAIRLAPTDANLFDARGNAFLQGGSRERALGDFNEAIRLDPANAQAFIDRGATYYVMGQFEKAVADETKAISLDATKVAAFANRSAAYSKLKEPDRALADDDEAIRLDPSRPELYDNRGLTYAYLHDYDHAIADYDTAIKLAPRANFLTDRGDSYQYKKDYDRAIADYEAAIKLDPKFFMTYNNLGAAYWRKHDYDRAIANYRISIKLNPADDTAFENLKAVERDRARIAAASPAANPTFDCASAKRAVEKAICSDQELTQLDRDMNAAYRSALSRVSGANAARLRDEQRAFIANRNRQFGQPGYQLKAELERRQAQLLALEP